MDVLHGFAHDLGSVCCSGKDSFLDAGTAIGCAFSFFRGNMGSTGSRTFLPCTQNGEAPLCRLLGGRNLGAAVIIRSNALCWGESEKIIVLLLVCEIKKEPTVSFQNDWLRGQQKSADNDYDYLPSLSCILLLLGFVSILNGKTPIFHLRF